MIIGTFGLGDCVTTLTVRHAVSRDDMDTYILTNTDSVTGKSYSKSFTGENDAVRAFCACIVSDEPDLSAVCKGLRSDPAIVEFLA